MINAFYLRFGYSGDVRGDLEVLFFFHNKKKEKTEINISSLMEKKVKI